MANNDDDKTLTWRLDIYRDRISMVSASADPALVQLLVLNGGAAVAVLAFAEGFSGEDIAAVALPKVANALMIFTSGAAVAVLAMIIRFFAVSAEAYALASSELEIANRWYLAGQICAVAAILAALSGLFAFFAGVWIMGDAINALA